jgi:hypothetical protein
MNYLGQEPQAPQQQPNPFAYLAAKYWWITIPVFAIAMKRHLERRKKGNATAFDVFNDLGILSFPITGVTALYEFGKAKQERDDIRAQLTMMAQQKQQ